MKNKAKRGLIFSCRAYSGKESKYVARHMRIIETQCDVIDCLTTTSPQHCKVSVETASGLNINSVKNLYGEFYDNIGKYMNSWEEVYNALDVEPLRDYDSLYLIAGIFLNSSGMGRTGKRVGVFPKDNGQLKFMSHAYLYVNTLALLKAHHIYDIPLHEFQYDTGEISLRLFHEDYRPNEALYSSYYNHDLPQYNVHRIDSLQYFLKKKRESSLCSDLSEKTIDFAFAYSVLNTSHRQNYPGFVDSVASNFNIAKVYTKNKYTGVDTSIDTDIYTAMIEKTRFTMILPAYDRNSYAIDRFLTALESDCLPIIHPDANNKVVEDSYGVSLEPLTLHDPSDVRKYSETKRLELLEYYKSKFLKVERNFCKFS